MAVLTYLKRMTSTPSIRNVLDFWFLPLDHPEHGKQREIWWAGPPEFDAEIRDRFSAAVDDAMETIDHVEPRVAP